MNNGNVPLQDRSDMFGGKQHAAEEKEVPEAIEIEPGKIIRGMVNVQILWIVSWISLAIGLIGAIVKLQVISTAMLGLFIGVLFLIRKKSKEIDYTTQSNYFSVNLSKTLRGFIRKQLKAAAFYPHAATLAWISIVVLFIEQVALRNFLHYSLATAIYALATLLFLTSVLMLFSEQDTNEAAVVAGSFAVSSFLSAGFAILLFGYLPGQNLVFGAVALYAMEWLRRAEMVEIDLVRLKKESMEANKKSASIENAEKAVEKTKEEKEEII